MKREKKNKGGIGKLIAGGVFVVSVCGINLFEADFQGLSDFSDIFQPAAEVEWGEDLAEASSQWTEEWTEEDGPYVEVNGGEPYFNEDNLTNEEMEPGYEFYSPLDELGRCGTTFACVGEETMPTEKRGSIGMVKPTGWHTVRYDDLVEGKYLYNRCHLIGYQLSGENANEQNLITGTRYLNVTGMLPFENEIADYVEETGCHVLYRVTPIFQGDDLVARGVLMEASSLEDDGEDLEFCIFAYNVQPGVYIDYATGESAAYN